jgi:hypothetical protein
VASFERQQIDSFSTWYTSTGVDINNETGDIFVIHNGVLFRFQNKKGTYVKLPAIAPLQTRIGSACISVNENTGELAVIHQAAWMFISRIVQDISGWSSRFSTV